MRLNQVTVPCLDVARSIAFYQALGLELIVHSNAEYARFAVDGGASFSLHRVESLPSGDGVRVYFEAESAPSLNQICAALERAGMSFEQPPTDMRWLWREAHLRDPDANKVILYFAGENRLFPPWRVDAPPTPLSSALPQSGAPPAQLRPYQEADAPAVQQLWEAVFGYPEARNAPGAVLKAKVEWDRRVKAPPLLIVATRQENLVGTAMLGFDGHRGWLYRLAVAREARRQGVGRQLVQEAESRLRSLGCTKLNLQVHADNEAAARFWEAQGFSREARIDLGKDLTGAGPSTGGGGC